MNLLKRTFSFEWYIAGPLPETLHRVELTKFAFRVPPLITYSIVFHVSIIYESTPSRINLSQRGEEECTKSTRAACLHIWDRLIGIWADVTSGKECQGHLSACLDQLQIDSALMWARELKTMHTRHPGQCAICLISLYYTLSSPTFVQSCLKTIQNEMHICKRNKAC